MGDIAVDYATLAAVEKNVRILGDMIKDVDISVSEVSGQVGQVSRDLSTTQSELLSLRQAFEDYVDEARKTAAVQKAETKIGNLKAELDRQYGHYAVVRRTSVGVLQAFDVGNVSDDVVAHVSEELMIQSPRYWLAPALVGIAAWSRDDKAIADRSIMEAFKRNPAKTSLFFSLVLRRMGRHEAALRWLRHYLQSCDSSALTREFAVILEASAQGAFGPDGAQLLSGQIRTWNDELRLDETVVRTQVDEWVEDLRNNQRLLAEGEYFELEEICPAFYSLKNMLNSASALSATTEKYLAVREASVTETTAIADMLDDLLEQLVTEYDDEELPLRREVAFNEAIIETDGDMQRAKQKSEQYQRALEETVDAVTLQTRTAISPEQMGVSAQTQRVSIGAGQEDFLRAVSEYTKDYRSQAILETELVLDNQHSPQAQAWNFVGHTSSTSEPEQAVMARLNEEWNRSVIPFVQQATFKSSSVIAPIVIGFVVMILGFAINPVLGVLIMFGGGAGIGFWVYNKKNKSKKELANIEDMRKSAFEFSRQKLLAARAAFVDLQLEYQELDADETALRNLIETWPTAKPKAEMKGGNS